MSVPDFQSLMRPILVALADGAAHSSNEIRDAVAVSEGVSDVDRQEMLPSGQQSTYSNRVAWALSHLGQAMLIDRVARGTYRIADRGQGVLEANPTRVDMGVLNQFPEYVDFRKRKHADGSDVEFSRASDLPPSEAMAKLTAEADAEVAGDLLLRILQMPPAFDRRVRSGRSTHRIAIGMPSPASTTALDVRSSGTNCTSWYARATTTSADRPRRQQ